MIFFRKTNIIDRSVSNFQDNVANSFGPLLKLPIVDGILLTGIVLATGSNQFAHNLARQPIGWMVADLNAAATIYRTAWTDKTLSLTASAPVTLNLWVF